MQVINGKVLFSRTVKPADYEGKKAECELSYVIEDGEDAFSVSAIVMEKAQDVVLAAVRLSAQRATPKPVPAAPAVVPAEAAPQAGKPEPAPQVHDNGWGEPTPPTPPATTGAAAYAPSAPPPTTPSADVTDAAIRKAIENKVDGAKATGQAEVMTVKIKELIAKHTGAPQKAIYSCEPAKRAAFLAELATLSPPPL